MTINPFKTPGYLSMITCVVYKGILLQQLKSPNVAAKFAWYFLSILGTVVETHEFRYLQVSGSNPGMKLVVRDHGEREMILPH